MSEKEDQCLETVAETNTVEIPDLDEKNLEGKSLLELVKKQIEFYFSRQNIQTDGFLVSKMNSNMEVPLAVIAEFAKIKALTKDPAVIVEALKDSQVCVVTSEGIKPNFKTERNTIILREIPSDTPAEKVKEIFTGDGIAPIVHIRSDVGDTWFVTMSNESDAVNAILALGSKQFEGKPIKARLKSENILRSFFPVPTTADAPLPTPAQFPMASPLTPPFLGGGMQPFMMNPRPGPMPGYFNMHPGGGHSIFMGRGPGRRNDMMGPAGGASQFSGGARMPPGAPRIHQPGSGPRNQHSPGPHLRNKSRGDSLDATADPYVMDPSLAPQEIPNYPVYNMGPPGSNSFPPGGRGPGRGRGGDRGGRGRVGGLDKRHGSAQRSQREVDFTASDFPALPGQGLPGTKRKTQKPGYDTQFKKYDVDEILQIVSSLSLEDIKLPPDFDLESHETALVKEPNMGLLRNQRTISIDETREVLKQGKPLIRDSVMHGEVDYDSMKGDPHRSKSRQNFHGQPSKDNSNPSKKSSSQQKKDKKEKDEALQPPNEASSNAEAVTEVGKEQTIVEQKQMGGYAAALMKKGGNGAGPAPAGIAPNANKQPQQNRKKNNQKKAPATLKKEPAEKETSGDKIITTNKPKPKKNAAKEAGVKEESKSDPQDDETKEGSEELMTDPVTEEEKDTTARSQVVVNQAWSGKKSFVEVVGRNTDASESNPVDQAGRPSDNQNVTMNGITTALNAGESSQATAVTPEEA